jgi:TonB family protein
MYNKQLLFKKGFSVAILLSITFHIIVGLVLILNSSKDISVYLESQEIPQMHVSWISMKAIGDMRLWKKQEYLKNQDVKNRNAQIEKIPEYLKTIDSISIQVPEEKASMASFVNSEIIEKSNCKTDDGKTDNEVVKQSLIISRIHSEQSDPEVSVRLPRPRYYCYSPPIYPWVARKKGYEGVVLISVKIDVNGKVGLFKIKKSSGYAVLDRSASDAVKSWIFEPGQRRGKPVTMWIDVPVKFELKDPETLS